MIRLRKPVRLLEWGEGTNTTNQVWTPIGEGKIARRQTKMGLTTLTIEMNGSFAKKNPKDNSIKIAQQGEGMAMSSQYWGEVALGYWKSVNGNTVEIEIPTATKFDTRSRVPAWEEEPAE